MDFDYTQELTLEERKAFYQRMRRGYDGMLFVILERHRNSMLPELPTNRLIVSEKLSAGHFQQMIRRELQLRSDVSCFFYMGRTPLLCDGTSMATIGRKMAHEDGHLYISYSEYNNFFVD